MYLNVINPTGICYSVDLTIPLWRLELARWGTDPATPTRQPYLGLVLRYVTGVVLKNGAEQTVTQVVYIAGIDTKTAGDELINIVAKGFPHETKVENRRAFKEAIGIFHNALEKGTEADDLIERTLTLVDIRHDLLDGMWGQRPDALTPLGPVVTGIYEGYRYALVNSRFDKWLGVGSMGDGSGGLVIVPPGAPKLGNLTKGKKATKSEPETLAPL